MAGGSAAAASGNIKATFEGGVLSVTRVSDGATLIKSSHLSLSSCDGVGGCIEHVTLIHTWPPGAQMFGTGEHMNTHGIAGRLPADGGTGGSYSTDTNHTLPSLDMTHGTWDFESCTVYSDSSGAEICIPWVIAAAPPGSGSGKGGYEFGVLWNMPNFGSMQLGSSEITWVANDPVAAQIDLFVTTYSASSSAGTAKAAKRS